jgi:hypothetical protein
MRVINFVICIILGFTSQELSANASKVFERNKHSVVKVIAKTKKGQIFSQGSGIVFNESVIATNKHVIEGADSVYIVADNDTLLVIDINISADEDIAFLSIAESLTPVTISTTPPSIGDEVFTIGNPMGLNSTFSNGIISGIRGSLIQTTAPISPGSSGGALLNDTGEVIGITTLKVNGGENLNFAISITKLFDTQIVKFQKPVNKQLTPLLNGYYIYGKSTVNSDWSMIELLKKDDLIFDRHEVYATTAFRMWTENPDAKTRWIEVISRIVINCASGTYATLTNQVFTYDGDMVFSKVNEELEWKIPTKSNAGVPKKILCDLTKLSETKHDIALDAIHTQLLWYVEFMMVRVTELFDPDVNSKMLTPLGKHLQLTQNDNFPNLDMLVAAYDMALTERQKK